MTEIDNLKLIIEAINYCKRVRSLGMPKSCYSKALREPIFFLWEKRPAKNKYDMSKFRSVSSRDMPNNSGNLVYDHAIPFNYILEKLLSLDDVNVESVRTCLTTNLVACTITRTENILLNKSGLQYSMPVDWDGADPLYRYKKVDIKVYEQHSN